MMKRIFLLLILTIVGWSVGLFAQEEIAPAKLSDDERKVAAKQVTDNYNDWKTVTLSGKIDLENVPVSPSVKIYMVHDRCVVISIRVPLVGEIGTVEVTGEKVTLVNKVKRTYCTENISGLLADLPIGISDLQDLFLGRIFLPEYGTLSMQNYEKADFYIADDVEGWFILPLEQPVAYDVACGYNTFADGRTDNLFVSSLDGQNQATAYYQYDRNRMNIELELRTRGKDRQFDFRISDVEYGGKSVQPAKTDGKYRKVSLSEFFKNLI